MGEEGDVVPTDVTRKDFPDDFIFGSATAAFQVRFSWEFSNFFPQLFLIFKPDLHSRSFLFFQNFVKFCLAVRLLRLV